MIQGGTLHEDCISVIEGAYVAAVSVQSVAISGILVPVAYGRLHAKTIAKHSFSICA